LIVDVVYSSVWKVHIVYTVFARVYGAPRFLGQEFGNNNSNLFKSRTRFYLYESKIFAIAFAALWLSLAAFTVICQ
jgi:hypothetical protein